MESTNPVVWLGNNRVACLLDDPFGLGQGVNYLAGLMNVEVLKARFLLLRFEIPCSIFDIQFVGIRYLS